MEFELQPRVASNHPDRVRFLDVLRYELGRAEQADLAVAFTRFSGLGLIIHELEAFLARGGKVRILTSTYLNFTQADALRSLVKRIGRDRLRVFDTPSPGFHTKLFAFGRGGVASCWVGSSNLTKGGLASNLELNVHHHAPDVVSAIHHEFELLWGHPASVPPTEAFLADYTVRQLAAAPRMPTQPHTPPQLPANTPIFTLAEAPADYQPTVPTAEDQDFAKPNEAQCEALERLSALRARGEKKAVIIAAPGIGKTFLSAFDARAAGARRVLFVSHRLEHLRQAERTFQQVFPAATTALMDGTTSARGSPQANFVFATVQTLASRPHIAESAWDYLVVDEFHHAHAPTYRAVIAAATSAFLLGLTATPERQDGHDVLQLCDYNVAWEVRLPDAIRRRWLVPFHYFGVSDPTVDYSAIPWRSGGFDITALENAVSVESRVDLALQHALDKGYDGTRRATVGFCAGRKHSTFMADAFVRRGLHAISVTGDMPIAQRERVYRDFADPSHPLEWLFVADVLNEGVDIPVINSILFLRPTDSATIFIQQLGRGLRLHPDCEVLTVVDLVGHHRRAWITLSTLEDPSALPGVSTVTGLTHSITPPPGCELVLDNQTKDMLLKVERFVSRKKDRCREAWERIRDELGEPPYPVDFIGRDEDVSPSDFRSAFGDWVGCRVAMGDAEEWEETLPADAPLRAFLARCEANWQAQRIYAYARLWGSVVAPSAPEEGYARFFNRFPRWRAEDDPTGFERAAKTLDKKLGHLWQHGALDKRIFGVIPHERLIAEVERRLQYQLEQDLRQRHGGVLRAPADLVPWRRYRRPEIINHFGRQFDPARHNSGVITFSEPAFAQDIVIITKLDTSGSREKYHYTNGFDTSDGRSDVFRWQSQNKNTPEDATGRRLVTPGAARLHLFVQEKSHATAVYCGAVTPIRYEGSAPIDVWFRLPVPVPPGVMEGLTKG